MLNISTPALLNSLKIVAPAIGDRSSLPILTSVLFEVEAGADNARLTAFNMTEGISTLIAIESKSEKDLSFTIPFDLLNSLVGKLKDGEIKLDYRDNQVFLVTTYGEFTLSSGDAVEFPSLPVVDAAGVSLDWLDFGRRLSLVIPYVSSEISKHVLTAVSVKAESGKTEFASTDSHRLVVTQTESNLPDGAWLLTAGLVKSALAAFKNAEVVEFSFQGNLASFSDGVTKVIGFLVQGDYPRYNQLIPAQFTTQSKIDPVKLSHLLELASPIEDNSNYVGIDGVGNTLKVSREVSGMGAVELEMEAEGCDGILLGLNLKYIKQALKSFDSSVMLHYNTSVNPVILKTENVTHLLMPIMKRS